MSHKRTGGITNHRLIMYSLSIISAKNYQNQLMWVEVIVCNISVVFLRHSVLNFLTNAIVFLKRQHNLSHINTANCQLSSGIKFYSNYNIYILSANQHNKSTISAIFINITCTGCNICRKETSHKLVTFNTVT